MPGLLCTRCCAAEPLWYPFLFHPLNNPGTRVWLSCFLDGETEDQQGWVCYQGHLNGEWGIQDLNWGLSGPKSALNKLSHPREKVLKRLHFHNNHMELPGKPCWFVLFIRTVHLFQEEAGPLNCHSPHTERNVYTKLNCLVVDRWQPPWFEGT